MHILCPHCRSPIELVKLTTDEILCPSCGSTFRVEGETTATFTPGTKKFGRFELLGLVGSGAFGTVYKAHDPQLDRAVALKVPRSGQFQGDEDRARFLREARSVAQMRHPSIVPVHEVGEHEGTAYLISAFVDGVTLTDRLTSGRLSFRDSAALIADVADALHYAHEHGVIHRDVKPSNIMMDCGGRPHLMDFGLAKRDANEITMTIEGQVLGTPAYMSPEQARGESHRVDGRSDVYSLGVVLYLLLTGELPFRGNSRMLLHQVLHDEPRPPRKLNDRIPRDLETIVVKAMAKEPSRRYQSATELEADLRRFLGGTPVHARPLGAIGRSWRWTRRNPRVAGLTACVVGSLILGLAGVTWQWRRVEQHRRLAELRALDLSVDRGLDFCRRGQVGYGLTLLAGALASAPESASDLRYVIRANLAEWSSQLVPLVRSFRIPMTNNDMQGAPAAAFSPEGRVALIFTKSPSTNRGRLWDVTTGHQIGEPLEFASSNFLAFSPQGDTLTIAESRSKWVTIQEGRRQVIPSELWDIRSWDTSTGRPCGPSLEARNLVAMTIRSDPKALLTATKNGTVESWDLATGRSLAVVRHVPAEKVGQSLSFQALSPNGTTALVRLNGETTLWDVQASTPTGSRLTDRGEYHRVVFDALGHTLVRCDSHTRIQAWEIPSGVPLGPPFQILDEGGVSSWHIYPGERVVQDFDRSASITDTVSILGGRVIINATGDGVVVTDAFNGHPVGQRLRLGGAAHGLGFNPNTREILTFESRPDYDKRNNTRIMQIRVWDASRLLATLATQDGAQKQKSGPIAQDSVAFGSRYTRSPMPGILEIRDASHDPEIFGRPLRHGAKINAAAFSTDGRFVATGSDDLTARVWDSSTGSPVGPPLVHDTPVSGIAFSPDGRNLATGCIDGGVRVWDLTTSKPIGPVRYQVGPIHTLTIDSRRTTLTTATRSILRRWQWQIPPPIELPPNQVTNWVRTLTQMEIDSAGSVQLQDVTQ